MKRSTKNYQKLKRKLSLQPLQSRCMMAADFAIAEGPMDNNTITPIDYAAVGRLDFGDAPDSFGTTLAADGARHTPNKNLLLGALPGDAEPDGQPSASALRDGVDEDGVRFVGSFAVVTGRGAVDAWADTNGNGKFDESEKFIDAEKLSAGDNYFAAPDAIYYRFRVSAEGGLEATGYGGDGEVEDYCRHIPLRHIPKDPVPEPEPNPEDPVPPGDHGNPDPIPEDLIPRDDSEKPDDQGQHDDQDTGNEKDPSDEEDRGSTSLDADLVDQAFAAIKWR